MKEFFYLAWWFFRSRILGQKRPLQTVIFISDLCNLKCKHCSVYSLKNPITKSIEQIEEELRYSYNLGSRFVDFEGGETTLWKHNGKELNHLLALAKKIGFFSTTITTNAQQPFEDCQADSIWVSLDGVGRYHDLIRGEGAFEKLERNIARTQFKELSVNMVVNNLNHQAVEQTIRWAKENPHVHSISINFHTPFKGTEHLALDWTLRCEVIDCVIAMKKEGYPIMNSLTGLRLLKRNDYKRYCWMTNFIMTDGSRYAECQGKAEGVCQECGFGMAAESNAVMSLRPDTIWAGLKLRVFGK